MTTATAAAAITTTNVLLIILKIGKSIALILSKGAFSFPAMSFRWIDFVPLKSDDHFIWLPSKCFDEKIIDRSSNGNN